MSKVIGIDLGTTNSAAAIFESGRATVIPSAEGPTMAGKMFPSFVAFTKDVVSPRISIQSPQNKTYVTSDVELDFAVNEAVSQVLYCLDGKENQTMTGSTTLTGLARGAHNITLYAADLAGNSAASKTIVFNVNFLPLPDQGCLIRIHKNLKPFPKTLETGYHCLFERDHKRSLFELSDK
jgi:hypothetical protein